MGVLMRVLLDCVLKRTEVEPGEMSIAANDTALDFKGLRKVNNVHYFFVIAFLKSSGLYGGCRFCFQWGNLAHETIENLLVGITYGRFQIKE